MARRLRRDMSLPEVLIWQRLKGKQTGLKFRKQHPFGAHVIDFCCLENRLAIEVGGEAHNRGDRPARDERRDAFLGENGWHLLHVAAARILKDPDAAIDAITAFAARPLHHSPEEANGPPPRAGEDQK
ncbi:hypothetical protein ASG11_00600 [Sphingomonas sp. Leaf357]|uniref:endonuclease domain-containing protein n=1 Tax=Sphingomonas sp. Leaf357 TaxID=1736350 RepID=UPI0006F91596|nr:DUF559 domain-containing protein [Sphingomonas sp. Leaf357]KQS02961.1 hypothetical protein ASG11_00600 [Sphingomonas sp. Leaf357]